MSFQTLLDFLNKGVSPYHAVDTAIEKLKAAGASELIEREEWNVSPDSIYYVTRNNSSIIAFRTPKEFGANPVAIIGSHTDSPTFKIKPEPIINKEGYLCLGVEVYGGPIYTSWLDRNLKFAGTVFYTNASGKIESKQVISKHTFRIPQIAIHINRSVNTEGHKVNPQKELNPIIGLNTSFTDFQSILHEEADIKGTILSWDLGLFEDVPAITGGLSDEFIFGGRQDNLLMVSASLDAFLASDVSKNTIQCIASFDHEEIGSATRAGADSHFLDTTLERLYTAMNQQRSTFLSAMSESFAISADGAHAVHPALSEKHDDNHKPVMNGGPVIKINANMRYTSNPESIAYFKSLCTKASVPFQHFSSRNDQPCGSTIGNMMSKSLGIPTVDIGTAMLAMHSISETTGSNDYSLAVNVFKEFYNTPL